MDRISGALDFGTLEKLIFGPGSIAEIEAEFRSRKIQRALVVTGRTLGSSPHLDRLAAMLGQRCAGVFKGVAEHAAAASVRALVAEARRVQADALISFGGGSAADTVKIAIACIAADRDLTREGSFAFYQDATFETVGPILVNVAIPTTLSAGEYSYGAATTADDGAKGAIIDHRIGPIFAVHDPEIAVDTPDFLWLTSGIKCLDHAVEALYSAHGSSFTDALAAKALRLLMEHLPLSTTPDPDRRMIERGHCQTAALLSNYAASNTRYGLSHAVGHKLGPKWHIPHGVTSCIALPPAMRFMADNASERFEELARALDIDLALPETERAHACADKVESFIAALGVPRHLKEYEVDKSELNDVVSALHNQMMQAQTIGRDVTAEEMAAVVQACW